MRAHLSHCYYWRFQNGVNQGSSPFKQLQLIWGCIAVMRFRVCYYVFSFASLKWLAELFPSIVSQPKIDHASHFTASTCPPWASCLVPLPYEFGEPMTMLPWGISFPHFIPCLRIGVPNIVKLPCIFFSLGKKYLAFPPRKNVKTPYFRDFFTKFTVRLRNEITGFRGMNDSVLDLTII